MASNTFQLKLNLSPEIDMSKLQAAVDQINQAFRNVNNNKDIINIDSIKTQVNQATSEIKNSFANSEKGLTSLGRETNKYGDNLTNITGKAGLFQKAFAFNQITQAFQGVASQVNQLTQPFIDYEKALADLSAITGVSGPALDKFGAKAKELAAQFGGTAINQIESFKGVLSRLGPDIAKSPEALERMAKSINTVSAASGLSATASMEALTTSLLQFNVDLKDPVKASGEMEKMMHVLAAGAKEGAAEIPQVSQAITVAGVAASGAKLSFEETNAAIQVMAAGGKYGSEAGTALRNVLGLLQKASGPAEDAMKKMGTSSKELGSILTTQGLGAAILKLREGMNTLGTDAQKNAALMEIFGTENAAAAGILIKKADDIGDLTGKLTGTTTAYDQAAINMDTTAAKASRFQAEISNFFIGVGDAAGAGIATLASAANTLQGPIMMLGGLKTIIPPGFIGSITGGASALLQKLVPSLFVTTAATTATGATAMTTSFSFRALWAAMTGPVGLIVAGIAAVAAALLILPGLFTQSAKSKLEDAQAENELLDAQQKNLNAQKSKEQSNLNLIDQYELLGKKTNRTSEEEEKLRKITMDLQTQYPGTISNTKTFAENLQALSQKAVTSKEELEKLKKQMEDIETKKLNVNVEMAELTADVTFEEKIGKTFDSMLVYKSGNEEVTKTTKAYFDDLEKGIQSAASESDAQKLVADAWEQITSSSQYKSSDAKEKMQMRKDFDEWSGQQVGAMKAHKEKQDKVYEMEINKIKEFAAEKKSIQDKLDKGLTTTVNPADQKKVEEQIDNYKNTIVSKAKDFSTAVSQGMKVEAKDGQLVALKPDDLKKQLDDMIKAASEGGVDMKSVYQNINTQLAQGLTGDKTKDAAILEMMAGMEKKIKDYDLGKIMSKSMEIKDNLDQAGKIDELVAKYKSATTEAEKNSIAEQIKKAAPEAVQATGTMVDANGNVVTSYNVLTDKVKENAEAKKKQYSSELAAKQNEFQGMLNKESTNYGETKQKLIELADAKNKATGTENEKKVNQEYDVMQKKLLGNREEILNMATGFTKMGLTSEQAVNYIANAFGISKEEAQKLYDQQVKQTAEADATKAKVNEIANAFNASTSAAKSAMAAQKGAMAQLILDLKNGKITQEEFNQKSQEYHNTFVKNKKVETENTEATKEVEKLWGDEKEKNNKRGSSAVKTQENLFNLTQKQYELEKKNLEQKDKEDAIAGEKERIAKRIERTAADEINDSSKKIALLEKEKALLTEKFNLKFDDAGNVISVGLKLDEAKQRTYDNKLKEVKDKTKKLVDDFQLKLDAEGNILDFGVNISDAKKKQIQKDIKSNFSQEQKINASFGLTAENKEKITNDSVALTNSINEEMNKRSLLVWKTDIDKTKLNEEMAKTRKEDLKVNIQMGLAKPEELLQLLDTELRSLNTELQTLQDNRSKIAIALTAEGISDDVRAKLESDLLTIDQKIFDKQKQVKDNNKETQEANSKSYEQQLNDLERTYTKETEVMTKFYERKKAIEDIANNTAGKIVTIISDKEKETAIKRIEELKKNELITEEQYNLQKEEVELKHQKRLEYIQNARRGYELEQERQQAIELEQIELNKLNARLKILKKDTTKANSEETKNLEKQIGDLAKGVAEKKDLLLAYSGEIQTGVTDIFSNLFTGDEEAMKEPWRKIFSVMVGGLKKYVTGLAVELILSELKILAPAGGLVALLLVPALTGIINGALSAIVDPIFSSLLSFSTGGRVDSPTVAMVGDASASRPGDNTEWIVRDIDIQRLISDSLQFYRQDLYNLANNLIRSNNEVKSFMTDKTDIDLISVLTALQREKTDIRSFTLQQLNISLDAFKTALETDYSINIKSALNEINLLTAGSQLKKTIDEFKDVLKTEITGKIGLALDTVKYYGNQQLKLPAEMFDLNNNVNNLQTIIKAVNNQSNVSVNNIIKSYNTDLSSHISNAMDKVSYYGSEQSSNTEKLRYDYIQLQKIVNSINFQDRANTNNIINTYDSGVNDLQKFFTVFAKENNNILSDYINNSNLDIAGHISTAINRIAYYGELQDLTSDKLIALKNDINSLKSMENEQLSKEMTPDYFAKLVPLEIKVKQEINPVMTTPAMVQSEIVKQFNAPELQSINFDTSKIEQKLDNLINAIYENKDVYLDSAKVTGEVNRQNNLRNRRSIL